MKAIFSFAILLTDSCPAAPLPPVKIDDHAGGFVAGEPPQVFRPWGLNYGNAGRLIEDFWDKGRD